MQVGVDIDGPNGADEGVIISTDGHPFWVADLNAWVKATDLQPGQWLRTSAGTWVQITSVTRWTDQARVHNLTIEDLRTYYVLAGNTPVLVHNCPNGVPGVGEYLAKKAPKQVSPGVRKLEGQYVNDQGRVEPWVAHYDEYGRLIGRTDYNAGNRKAGIPDTHYHRYEYGPGRNPAEVEAHVPGEFPR